jgi:AraC-like DNA-binding protein
LPTINVGSAEEWAAAIASEIVPLRVRRISPDFKATIHRRDLADNFRITRVSSGRSSIQRAPSNITSADDGFAIFHLNRRGVSRISQHGRDCTLDELSATLYSTDRPSRLAFSAGNDGVLVQVPRELLPVSEAEFRQALIRPIVHAPLLKVLLALLSSSHEELPQLDRGGKTVIASTLLDLVGSLLRTQTAVDDHAGHSLLGRMLDHVDRSFADPDLNAAALARHFNVSTRFIYNTFARAGLHPAAHIRSVRLSRARKLIENTDMPMYAIGVSCGFGVFSTFVRAFKRVHAVSPSAWREEHSSLRPRSPALAR